MVDLVWSTGILCGPVLLWLPITLTSLYRHTCKQKSTSFFSQMEKLIVSEDLQSFFLSPCRDEALYRYILEAINTAFAAHGKRKKPKGNTNTGGRTSPDGSPCPPSASSSSLLTAAISIHTPHPASQVSCWQCSPWFCLTIITQVALAEFESISTSRSV